MLNRDNMGHFDPNRDAQILQTLMIGKVWGSPAYWLNQTYFWSDGDYLKAYRL